MNVAIANRRALRIEGYKTLAEVGFDGNYVTPYQITSKSMEGPVLIAYHWANEEHIIEHRDTLERLGYLPSSPFNVVLSLALKERNLRREDIYMTQTFHLVPTERSENVAQNAIDQSFDLVTRHEAAGRKVMALGDEAFFACQRHGVTNAVRVCHPSRRRLTNSEKARTIAAGLAELGF
jgi:hypothetical protein